MIAARNISSKFTRIFLSLFLVLSSAAVSKATAQQPHAAHGAISAQDLAKRAAPAAAPSDTADQVCARFPTGPCCLPTPRAKRQKGRLEITMQFPPTPDPQGLLRYCYVPNPGLEAP